MSRKVGELGIRRKNCPICGGVITVSDLYQYSRDYPMTKTGKVSKRCTVRDCGPVEVSIAGCECGAYWEVGDFDVDTDGNFYDYKYKEE